MFTNFEHAWVGRVRERAKLLGTMDAPGAAAEAAAQRLADEALPFLTMPYAEALTAQLRELTPFFRRFRHMLLLGIGGSALGARALRRAFFPQQDWPGHAGPWLWVLDNVDGGELSAMLDRLPAEETLVLVVSKSGGTIETLAQYFLVRRWLHEKLGERWAEHLMIITDARKGFLRQEAGATGCRSLPVPDGVGGRYSVFSAVGMAPAAFLGLPWEELLDGAQAITVPLTCADAIILTGHPAWLWAQWAAALTQEGYSQLIFFSYIPAWSQLGDWFAQLWAESLGKDGRGSMPLPAVGVTDQHSLQQIFLDGPADKGCIQLFTRKSPRGPIFPQGNDALGVPEAWSWLRGRPFGDLLDAECLATAAALAQREVPLLRVDVDTDARSAGHFMGLCMAATLFTGWLLDVNPLDQPAVELGKTLACARLGQPGRDRERKILENF